MDAMDAMMQIADEIKIAVSGILMSAISGSDKKYRADSGHIRWGLVEKDIHRKIDYHLIADEPKPKKEKP